MSMRRILSVTLVLGLLLCGTPAFAAVKGSGEAFPSQQNAPFFLSGINLSGKDSILEAASGDTLPGTATDSNATSETAKPATPSDADDNFDSNHQTLPPEIATDSNSTAPLTPEMQTVYTADELRDLLENYDGTGGTISFGATITLEHSIYFYGESVCINTGTFGLIYDGGCIETLGNDTLTLELTGEGIDMPVLEIKRTVLYPEWYHIIDWNCALSGMEVTAVGREGNGGTAVRVTADYERRTPTTEYQTRGRIRSYGDGAVGLELCSSAQTYLLDIEAEGRNACAVAAVNGADLFACKLSAQGEGAVVATGNGVILDSCILSGESDGVTVIQSTIESRTGLEPQLMQYTDSDSIVYDAMVHDEQQYLLSNGKYIDLYLQYDENLLEHLDTSVLGAVDIPVSLHPCFQGFGLEGEKELTFRIWIRDPAKPVITEYWQEDSIITFFSWYNDGLEPGTRLWSSKDGGSTWVDISDSDGVTLCVNSNDTSLFILDTSGLDQTIFLALKNAAGWSNVVTLSPGKDGKIPVGAGGDRDGGDREELPGGDGGNHDNGNTDDDSAIGDDSGSSGSTPPSEAGQGGQPDNSSGEHDDRDGNNDTTTDTGANSAVNESQQTDHQQEQPNNHGESSVSPSTFPVSSEKWMIDFSPIRLSQQDHTQPDSQNTQTFSDIPVVQMPAHDETEAVLNPLETPAELNSFDAVPNLEAQERESGFTTPDKSASSRQADTVLSVLVLCGAGGITAFVTFRKKRGER